MARKQIRKAIPGDTFNRLSDALMAAAYDSWVMSGKPMVVVFNEAKWEFSFWTKTTWEATRLKDQDWVVVATVAGNKDLDVTQRETLFRGK